jgi:methionine biosynthesis protein MetW
MSVKNFENNRWKNSDQKMVPRHQAALDLIDFSDKPKILDLGCGDGFFMAILNERGGLTQGLDISEEGVKKCLAKNLKAEVLDFETDKIPFVDKEFDYAVCLDCLEHMFFPEKLLAEAARVAKKLVIAVPNFSSLPARAQMLFGQVPENNHVHKGHIYWFNYQVLMKMLEKNNLSIKKLAVKTFWEEKPLIGKAMKKLKKLFPALFALSFFLLLEDGN